MAVNTGVHHPMVLTIANGAKYTNMYYIHSWNRGKTELVGTIHISYQAEKLGNLPMFGAPVTNTQRVALCCGYVHSWCESHTNGQRVWMHESTNRSTSPTLFPGFQKHASKSHSQDFEIWQVFRYTTRIPVPENDLVLGVLGLRRIYSRAAVDCAEHAFAPWRGVWCVHANHYLWVMTRRRRRPVDRSPARIEWDCALQ